VQFSINISFHFLFLTLSGADYIESNDTMINGYERIWKEAAVA
jgi:hypothetical protein